eukprot:10534267-Alexandrium_andersonii.AAC.1
MAGPLTQMDKDYSDIIKAIFGNSKILGPLAELELDSPAKQWMSLWAGLLSTEGEANDLQQIVQTK